VYTGSAVNALSLVAFNDDDATCPSSNRASTVAFAAVSGTTYRIRVDGYSSNTGAFEISRRTSAPAPTVTGVVTGDHWANVAWTSNGGGGNTITSWAVTRQPGNVTTTFAGASRRATITGLTNGTAYAFTVRAVTAAGNGAESAPANGTPSNTTLNVVTSYSSGENSRLVEVGNYLGRTPAQLQTDGVFFIAFLINLGPPSDPTPSEPPTMTGPATRTGVWPAVDQGALTTVTTKYALTPSEAQYVGTQFMSFLLALGGH
jgi:hypothetical protein